MKPALNPGLAADFNRLADASRSAYNETQRQKVCYTPLDWARDFGTDLSDLDKLTVAVPGLGTVNQWLDGRDGFPNFPSREMTVQYLADREVHALALIAALTLKKGPNHAPWCFTRAAAIPGPEHACDCGAE